MIIVLKQDAPDVQIREFCHELEDMGLQINDSKGSDAHILGLIGDTKAIAESWVLANPVVETCRRVSEPYKKANRKFHPDDSVIDVDGVKIGGGNFAVIAGPCSSVPNCNQGCPFLKEFLEFFNKEFIVWERVSMYNKYHKGKIFILYDRF